MIKTSKKEKKEKISKPKFSFVIQAVKQFPNVDLYKYVMDVKMMKEKTIDLYEKHLLTQCDLLDQLKIANPNQYNQSIRVLWLDFSSITFGDPALSKKSSDIMLKIEPRGHFVCNIIIASFIAKAVLDQIFEKNKPIVPTFVKGSIPKGAEILMEIYTSSLKEPGCSKLIMTQLETKYKKSE